MFRENDLASGQCPKNQLSKAYYVKLKTLTEFGQELQIDFTGKLYFQKNGTFKY